MKQLYIQVARFNLEISLKESNNPAAKSILEKEIFHHLHGFFLKKKPKRIDYEIEINDQIAGKVYKKNNPLMTIFPKNTKNKVITSYETGYFNFQLIIQNILYKLLSENNGFFIHASASNINGKAYLFTGMSGAGKSTIVKLLSERFPPLSDDLSIIRKINGKFYYFQHPILEKNFIKNKSPKHYPIGKICFLKKSKICRMDKIHSKEAVFKRLGWQIRSLDKENIKTFIKFTSGTSFFFVYFSKNKENLLDFFQAECQASKKISRGVIEHMPDR